MPRFMMLYKGDATDAADMTEEERQAVMAAWGQGDYAIDLYELLPVPM
jgi:hypothetical protein